jgi:Tol biopolymer transport system component
LPLGSSGVSWNPDQTKGIVYLDSGFASRTLYWLSSDGRFKPLDLVIKDGARSWNLKDDFPDFKADDTGKTGSTGRAVWSPDGKSIALFASPNAVGKTGFQRFGVEYYLYLMDPENLELSVVAENIYSPFLIQWSPDSTHIAFIGYYGFWKENGLWLYSLKDQSITSIAKSRFQDLAWTSNNSLAAIHCEDIDVCTQILEYDLTRIVEP